MTSYTFGASWVTPLPPARVHALLLDLEHYPDWWPEIRAVLRLGDDDAVVLVRSVLPMTLTLHLHAVSRSDDVVEVALDGDLAGFARWRLTPSGTGTRMDFEQRVRVRRRRLALASRVARPLLVWNHDRMLTSAQRSMELMSG